MEIVVNDTNIFIDLISVGLLEEFFKLPFQIHTIDLVLAEIEDETQIAAIKPFITQKKLYVKKYSYKEITELSLFHETCQGNVSIVDCAVMQFAEKNNYTLLTGDKCLRKNATCSGIVVKGILFVFDCFVDNKILSPNEAAKKLIQLHNTNIRLPHREVCERIERWKK